MKARKSLTIAYTPDSDDAFYYDSLETGHVSLPGFVPRFSRKPVSDLNQAALLGEYDVTAISSVIYPQIAGRYAILSVGTSVGRGYGPVLVSRSDCTLAELHGRRVGVPGFSTTGCFLLRSLCPGAVPVEMVFDEIAAAVAAGDLSAGVMIHEELLYYPQMGLKRVVDLGAAWCEAHDLPLPVGLNVARRDLGAAELECVCAAIRRSLRHALSHRTDTLTRVGSYGRGPDGGCTEQFVSMFANQDSLNMPGDVRAALRVLFCQVVDLGLAATVPQVDIIEGYPEPVAQSA
jgi:1,4-dihydroxy-6-naphthoate synthase